MQNVIWLSGHELLLADIVQAENCHLYDAAGKRYVDLESGVWCTPIGHGHPAVLRVMAEQASKIAHVGFCYANPRWRPRRRRSYPCTEWRAGNAFFCAPAARPWNTGFAWPRPSARDPC